MKNRINRRDFIKLSGSLSLGLAAPRFLRDAVAAQAGNKPNVLIIVFDALSAMNISFYGYGRQTTPNLASLSGRAVVYHNHYAPANFTSPGTASLLTGTHPWTHRAFQGASEVAVSVESRNLFNTFEGYYRIAYTHNPWAYILLKQFKKYIEELLPRQKLFLKSYDSFIHSLFSNDDDLASVAWERNIETRLGYSYSLFLSHLDEELRQKKIAGLKTQYPLGLPSSGSDINVYLLEQATNWIGNRLTAISQPFLGYFHFLPPHQPYRTSSRFYRHFAGDGLRPVEKPVDIFRDNKPSNNLLRDRTEYDEYILYADNAFGDLFHSIEASGLLENTWVVFTSDHGEMFERGLVGHGNPTLYQPLLRIPLLIFEPGRKTGINIQTMTSAVDVLPTLLHLTGQSIPDWAEGMVLPPYSSTDPDPNRSFYALAARDNSQYSPFTNASTALIKGHHKLIYCFGYPKINRDEIVQLFDIDSDPEELNDLYSSKSEMGRTLFAELKAKLDEVNEPYF